MRDTLKQLTYIACAIPMLALIACSPDKTSRNDVPHDKVNTLETVKTESAVSDYSKNPTERNKIDVEKALADLKGEIDELEVKVKEMTGDDKVKAEGKLKMLRQQYDDLKADFNEAKYDALKNDIKNLF